MEEFLKEVSQLFLGSSVFTELFGDRFSANFAFEGTDFPLAVYILNPMEPVSKDGEQFSVQVSFYFALDKLMQCAQFYDAIKPVLLDSDFDYSLTTPGYDIDNNLNKFSINLSKIK